MHAHVQLPDLKHAFKLLRPALNPNAGLPLLACVRLQRHHDHLTLEATNQELRIQTQIPNLDDGSPTAQPRHDTSPQPRSRGWSRRRHRTTDLSQGTAIVRGAQLRSFLTGRHPKHATVTLTLDDTILRVAVGSRSVSLPTYPPADWPSGLAHRPLTKVIGEADSHWLRACWERVAPACATDAIRPVLAGVHLRSQNGLLHLAATDSYRLHILDLPGIAQGDTEVLIPPEAVHSTAAAAKTDGLVSLWVTTDPHPIGTEVELRTTHTTIRTRTIEGEYPPVTNLIPETTNRATVHIQNAQAASGMLQDLDRQVGRAGASVKLTFTDTGVTVSMRATDSLHIDADKLPGLLVETSPPPVAHWFNPRYLADLIAATGDDGVLLLEPKEAERSMVVRNGGFTGLLMPVRSNSD